MWKIKRRISQKCIEVEHYLCTVAAGGHKRIVKPIRKGVRHGHEAWKSEMVERLYGIPASHCFYT